MSIYHQSIEFLLESLHSTEGRGRTQAFLFGPIGAMQREKTFSAEVNYDESALLKAILHIRSNGPTYLRRISLGDIRSLLFDFVSDNFWYLANEVYFRQVAGPFANVVSNETKILLTDALETSDIFRPDLEVTLFPLMSVRVKADFETEDFFFAAPETLGKTTGASSEDCSNLNPSIFPPDSAWQGRKEKPEAWLGIRSPAVQASRRMKRAILGTLSLTIPCKNRYVKSQRVSFGGWCTVGSSLTFNFSEPHVPSLFDAIELAEPDHPWLEALSERLRSSDKHSIREVRALEYFYRAWFLEESDRFLMLCMTLDSIYGEANHAAQAVVDGILATVSEQLDPARIRLLLDLRAALVHGGAPEIYDSRKYPKYYRKYESDPMHDLSLLVAESLKKRIFGDALREHPDPKETEIADAIAKGLIPKSRLKSILDI